MSTFNKQGKTKLLLSSYIPTCELVQFTKQNAYIQFPLILIIKFACNDIERITRP
jgi:hypothetical protein